MGTAESFAPSDLSPQHSVLSHGGTTYSVCAPGRRRTFLEDHLRGIVSAIALSRPTTRNIEQNLFAAFVDSLLLIPAAAAGFLHPIWAAGAMARSSVSVVGNALRLRHVRPPVAAAGSG